MVDPEYSLAWPKALFMWEARRVMRLPDDVAPAAITLLLTEAFHDPGVSQRYCDDTDASMAAWDPVGTGTATREWLDRLLSNDDQLRPYVPPKYWAERNGHLRDEPQLPGDTLDAAVLRQIYAFQDTGYFPHLLPRDCVDDPTDYDTVTRKIREATHLTSVTWPPGPPDAAWLSDEIVYTLIESFHDHAQRPRTFTIHEHADCGLHFPCSPATVWNSESGTRAPTSDASSGTLASDWTRLPTAWSRPTTTSR